MTTKPKTRKAPAAKAAPKAAPKEAAAEPKREESEIGALVSRWGWLAADMAYKAATAPTEKENEAAFQIHTDEQMTIETKLAGLVPENFGDVCDLLEFATQKADEGGRDGLKIGMLRNARSGCPWSGKYLPWSGASTRKPSGPRALPRLTHGKLMNTNLEELKLQARYDCAVGRRLWWPHSTAFFAKVSHAKPG